MLFFHMLETLENAICLSNNHTLKYKAPQNTTVNKKTEKLGNYLHWAVVLA